MLLLEIRVAARLDFSRRLTRLASVYYIFFIDSLIFSFSLRGGASGEMPALAVLCVEP